LYDVVVKKFTFAISSPDEFLYTVLATMSLTGHNTIITICIACLKNDTSKLHEIFCRCYPGPWLGPWLCTSVTFSRNGPYGVWY